MQHFRFLVKCRAGWIEDEALTLPALRRCNRSNERSHLDEVFGGNVWVDHLRIHEGAQRRDCALPYV